MPLTLDLNDPRPGSLLISGDPGSGARRLLHALLLSTAQLNTPAQAGIYRISPADHYEPSQPDGPTARPGLRQRSRRGPLAAHLRQALNPADPEAQQLLVALEGLVVQRRRSSDPNQGPAVLLAIEDLDAFLDCLDEESFARLHALAIHGPRARVWVMATLDATRVDRIDSRILDGFRTRLLGSIASPALAAYLAEDGDSNAHRLRPGKEFTVAFNHTWLTIRIPEEAEVA